jgi:branched-chain amino acid transport system substrate-binding protein
VTVAELPPESLGVNVFSVNPGLAFQGQVLARFAKQELRVEQVAVVVDGRERAPTTLADVFVREFSKANTSHVHQWTYKNPSDFSDFVERIKKAQPGAILHAGSVVDLGRLRGKLQAAGIKAPVLFGGDTEHLSLSGSDREASNGVYVATPYVVSDPSEENQKFVKMFQERYKQAPDLQAALAYDGIRVVCEAMRRAKTLKAAEIRSALAEMSKTPFDKSLSGSWTFDSNHAARRPLFVGKLENGVVTNPKAFPPEAR